MGVVNTARNQFTADVAAFKATTPTRNQMRRFVAAMRDSADEWLSKRDAQDNAAPADFAASKQSQYDTFTAALPDIILGPVDPAT